MNSLQAYGPSGNEGPGGFEAACEKRHREAMCAETAGEARDRDEEAFAPHGRVCPQCQGLTHPHGKTRAMVFLAVSGEVSARLRRLRCTACGHIVVPGISLAPATGVTAALAERICDLAAKMPYAKACESPVVQQGARMSTKRPWSCVQAGSRRMKDVLAREADGLYADGTIPDAASLGGTKPLIIGIDGGWVGGWRSNPGLGVKCATIATGSLPGPGRQRHLADRVGHAAQCSADDFRRRVSVLAIKSGHLSASMRIFVSDGASWTAKMIAGYFPDAVHVLDLYHLKHRVETLFNIRAEGYDAGIRDAALAACDTFDPDLITDIVTMFWGPRESAKIEVRDDLVAYIQNNAQAIRNHRLVGIHGPGWIEKGVDLMVSRRMKNRGMAWTEKGSANMIPFAVLRYNRQWDVYWNGRKGLTDEVAA